MISVRRSVAGKKIAIPSDYSVHLQASNENVRNPCGSRFAEAHKASAPEALSSLSHHIKVSRRCRSPLRDTDINMNLEISTKPLGIEPAIVANRERARY
jgi:hypothetical protein